jgi:hypothetical protein
MNEFDGLMSMDLTQTLQMHLLSLYLDELEDLDQLKESSKQLQQKCQLLYLICRLSQESIPLAKYVFEQVTLPSLRKLNYQTRFPIQEKYLAAIHLNLMC